jgi:hypothetical protein
MRAVLLTKLRLCYDHMRSKYLALPIAHHVLSAHMTELASVVHTACKRAAYKAHRYEMINTLYCDSGATLLYQST